jgi:hypothetical protein
LISFDAVVDEIDRFSLKRVREGGRRKEKGGRRKEEAGGREEEGGRSRRREEKGYTMTEKALTKLWLSGWLSGVLLAKSFTRILYLKICLIQNGKKINNFRS